MVAIPGAAWGHDQHASVRKPSRPWSQARSSGTRSSAASVPAGGAHRRPTSSRSGSRDGNAGLRSARMAPSPRPEARAKARLTLAEIDCGHDLARRRDARRRMSTVAEFADKWLDEHVALKRKPSTGVEYRRIVERHIKPEVGTLLVSEISHSDVARLHSSLAAARYVANRVVAVLSSLLSDAERRELRPRGTNPCRGLERFCERKRKRPLTKVELAKLWAHLVEIETEESPYVVAALRLLLLTGMRKSEVLRLLWADVDLDAGVIYLRDAKTGPRDVCTLPACGRDLSLAAPGGQQPARHLRPSARRTPRQSQHGGS